MLNATTTIRTTLSIAILSLVGVCAHAEIIYNPQSAHTTNTTANTTANIQDNTQLNGSRTNTQYRVLNTASSWSTATPNEQSNTNSSNNNANMNIAPSSTTNSTPVAIRTIPANVSVINQSASSASIPTMMATSLPLSGIPMPKLTISHIDYVTKVTIPISSYGNETLDVSVLDDFITEMIPHARHYPPNFDNTSAKYYATKELQELEQWLRSYAERPDASYEVLLRAAKLNGMARNLDFGSDYAVRASNYISRALKKQPNSAEANFLYGMMLTEGGGFNEGKKYLEKAVSLGYLEAEQSLAQSDLLRDRKSAALQRLQRLQRENPNNTQIRRQVALVQNGGYYIWDLD